MAKKISQLTQATEVKSDDVTVIVQDGETKKLPLNMMVTRQDIENKKVAGLAKLDEIEATYENDTYTPTITVKNKSSVKIGEGDGVDYSANVMDGPAKSAILKGNTLVNLVSRVDKSYFGSIGAINPTFNTSSDFISTIMTYPANNTDKKGAICFKITRFLQYAYNTDLIGLKGKTFTLLATIENGTNSDINIILSESGYNTVNGYTITTISSKTSQNIKTAFTVGDTNLTLGHNTILASSPEYCSMSNIVIVEGEFTNQDIPYFKSMESVKMPVLTTSNEDGTKTNILTVNEDVTLRSNGNVYDELDLLTGKLTQRIDEDGSVLTQDVVKTVDLMPSGTHPSTTPYCWKNGHIQLSGSGLLPNLEYSVVTSRAGQINQNATMIVKNDKRIFDLEILLAGGLVNTTYQALTLQNQVETGLSKVSLNSETEPDYLLYHMIMKLIEEKAYKLDDLTEKVSVFYLYEKLSDEQFETIYSALYPFVEDEIVEEPVVEELPEVVEDEVIM